MNEEIVKIINRTPETVSIEFNMETGEEVPERKVKKLWREFLGKTPFPTKPIKVFTLERREYLRLLNQYKAVRPEEAGLIDFGDVLEYGEPQNTLNSRCCGVCFNFDSEYAIFIDRESPDSFRYILKHELSHIKNEDWEKDIAVWNAIQKAA
jgi:hypothetical protein